MPDRISGGVEEANDASVWQPCVWGPTTPTGPTRNPKTALPDHTSPHNPGGRMSRGFGFSPHP
jgi:hypothetical protein